MHQTPSHAAQSSFAAPHSRSFSHSLRHHHLRPALIIPSSTAFAGARGRPQIPSSSPLLQIRWSLTTSSPLYPLLSSCHPSPSPWTRLPLSPPGSALCRCARHFYSTQPTNPPNPSCGPQS